MAVEDYVGQLLEPGNVYRLKKGHSMPLGPDTSVSTVGPITVNGINAPSPWRCGCDVLQPGTKIEATTGLAIVQVHQARQKPLPLPELESLPQVNQVVDPMFHRMKQYLGLLGIIPEEEIDDGLEIVDGELVTDYDYEEMPLDPDIYEVLDQEPEPDTGPPESEPEDAVSEPEEAPPEGDADEPRAPAP